MEKLKYYYKRFDDFLDKIFDFLRSLVKKFPHIIIIAISFILFFIAIYEMRNVLSGDVRTFLIPWYRNFYTSGFSALGKDFGDYTPAYMNFLYFVSLFKVVPTDYTVPVENTSYALIYFIKGFSLIHQIIASVFVYLITKEVTKNKVISSLALSVSLFAPALIFNSSWWGQCDAIYTSYLIIALYFLIKEKPICCSVFIGMSFAYKLQTIFFIPVILILFLHKKFKLRYLLLVPIIYILYAVPSLIAGKSLSSIINVYINQTSYSYQQLSLNCPSIWALLHRNFMASNELKKYAIMSSLLVTGIFSLIIYLKNIDLKNKKNLVSVAYLFSLLLPYFMPHMHDRYFYLADLFCILYIFINPKKFYIGILSSIASFSGYTRYLWSFNLFWVTGSKEDSEMSFRIGAIIMLIAIILLVIDIFKKDNIQEIEESYSY